MEFEHLLYEKADRVATVTINRPDVHNTMDTDTIAELGAVFDEIARDREVAALVLTGSGEKAFAAGADIGEILEQDAAGGAAMSGRGQRTLRKLETMGKPSIAAVNGYALGGGCELAMACTIRVAAEHAKFGQPEVNLGVIPGYAGTQRLPRLVGRGVAMELILTGRAIDAVEAFRIGLVTHVVPAPELMDTSRKLAKLILRKAPHAIKAAMESVDMGLQMAFENACNVEASLFGLLCETEDKREGLTAFLEKRKPEFKGK